MGNTENLEQIQVEEVGNELIKHSCYQLGNVKKNEEILAT